MQELVEYIAKSLVEDPAQVHVKVNENQSSMNLELYVAAGDMGRVIGKSGRVANAIRTLVRVAAVRQGKRATLEVVDQASPDKRVRATF
ncbi:MAG: KH domain-containing protein [Anaerolineae bacterium]